MPYLCHYNSAMSYPFTFLLVPLISSPSTFLLVPLAIPSSWETENKRHGSIKLWDSHFKHSHTDQEGEKKLLWASMSSISRLGVLGEAAREHSCADCSAIDVRSTFTLAERSNPPLEGLQMASCLQEANSCCDGPAPRCTWGFRPLWTCPQRLCTPKTVTGFLAPVLHKEAMEELDQSRIVILIQRNTRLVFSRITSFFSKKIYFSPPEPFFLPFPLLSWLWFNPLIT